MEPGAERKIQTCVHGAALGWDYSPCPYPAAAPPGKEVAEEAGEVEEEEEDPGKE